MLSFSLFFEHTPLELQLFFFSSPSRQICYWLGFGCDELCFPSDDDPYMEAHPFRRILPFLPVISLPLSMRFPLLLLFFFFERDDLILRAKF